LEFDVHRPLYDWFIEKLSIFPTHQYEFARLNLSHTVMSKRRLLQLVNEKIVKGWDDPRMPTISGLRRALIGHLQNKARWRTAATASAATFARVSAGTARRASGNAARAIACSARYAAC
jgi:glutamyl/glutaminyl-tRNA synthetase